MITQTINRYPVICMIVGAVAISFSSILVQLSGVSPTTSAFYRVFFGSLFLIAACAMKKDFNRIEAASMRLALFCGALFALDLFFWHWSIRYIGPGLATILGNFQVFALALVGFWVFKETITTRFILAVPLAVFGLFLVIGIDVAVLTSEYLLGVGLGLATALCYSAYLLMFRKIQGRATGHSPFYYLMIISAATAFFLGVKMVLVQDSFLIPSLKSFAALVTLGVVLQAIAWMVISNAMARVKASQAGLILLLQPSLSFVWDVLIFDRPTGAVGWTGVTIVIFAIYMGMSGQKKNTNTH